MDQNQDRKKEIHEGEISNDEYLEEERKLKDDFYERPPVYHRKGKEETGLMTRVWSCKNNHKPHIKCQLGFKYRGKRVQEKK